MKRDRFEPFYPVVPQVDCKSFKNSQFEVSISEYKMGFKIIRTSNNKVMWVLCKWLLKLVLFSCDYKILNIIFVFRFDSQDVGGFVYSDQFLQISAKFPPDSALYGIAERQSPMFINTTSYRTITLWNRDVAPSDGVCILLSPLRVFCVMDFSIAVCDCHTWCPLDKPDT